MARDKNTFVKRQREMLKKQKSQEKLARRKMRKDRPGEGTAAPGDRASES